MNNLARLIGRLSVTPTQRVVTAPHFLTRGFSSILPSSRTQTQGDTVLSVKPLEVQPSRSYKVRGKLKPRCGGCYFEKRFGRLYIECKFKGRHKQMQQVFGQGYYKDHYSKGKWWKAVHWGYKNNGRMHKWGDMSAFSKYDWLEGRLGTEI